VPIASKPWQLRPPGTLRTCPGMHWDCFTIPVVNTSLPFRQEQSMEPILKQSTSPLTSFFNFYYNILTSPKARSAKCFLPFMCQLNVKKLRLSSFLCLFHARSGSGPGPPRPSSKTREEIYSGPSINGTVTLSRFVLGTQAGIGEKQGN